LHIWQMDSFYSFDFGAVFSFLYIHNWANVILWDFKKWPKAPQTLKISTWEFLYR